MDKTTNPSREEVTKLAAETDRLYNESDLPSGKYSDEEWLYRFAAAMYAKGAEDMRERVIRSIGDSDDQLMGDFHIERIRALPITPTNTEGDHGEF